jgi:kinesin family protein 1
VYQIILSQDPIESDESKPLNKKGGAVPEEGLKLISETKLIPRRCALSLRLAYVGTAHDSFFRSDANGSTKKGHLMILTDAGQNIWERRWFVLKR